MGIRGALPCVLALAACGGERTVTCEEAMRHALDLDLRTEPEANPEPKRSQELAADIARCKDERWSQAELRCIVDSDDEGSSWDCDLKEPGLREDLKQAYEGVLPAVLDAMAAARKAGEAQGQTLFEIGAPALRQQVLPKLDQAVKEFADFEPRSRKGRELIGAIGEAIGTYRTGVASGADALDRSASLAEAEAMIAEAKEDVVSAETEFHRAMVKTGLLRK